MDGLPSRERCSLCHLHRRHAHSECIQRYVTEAHSTNHHSVGMPWFSSELSEVPSDSSQKMDFLGFVVDSVKRELSLPKEKVGAIKKEAVRFSKQEIVSPRTLASLLGKMSAAVLAVFPAPLYYRSLQVLKHKALKAAGYDNSISMSQEARKDLAWWARNLCQWNGRRLLPAEPQVIIETDASCRGLGAFSQGEVVGSMRRASFTSTCWSC